MRIEKIDLKKKVMLALLAGNLLCSANALAANTYVLNGGAPVEFTPTSGYDPTNFSMTGNTIVFNMDTDYELTSLQLAIGRSLTGASSADQVNDVNVSGHNVTVNVGSGVSITANACGGIAVKGNVTNNTLTVNGGNFIPSMSKTILGVAGGFAMGGNVSKNTVEINGVTCAVAGGGYTAFADAMADHNTLTVIDSTVSQFLVGAAAMDNPNSPSLGGNVQYNKLIIKGNSIINAWVYGGISRGTVTNPLPAIGNSVEIDGGTFSRYVYGVEARSEALENYVIVNNGMLQADVEGACVKASATGNYVIVNGGTFARTDPDGIISIFGGEVEGGSPNSFAKKNYVILNGGTFKNAQVYGAFNRAENGIAGSGSATGDPNDGNWVTVNNATFNHGISNKIYGASATGTSGQAYNNKVTINNGTFTGAADFSLEIAGGKAENAGTASNNSVNINNGTFIAAGTGEITIIGGDATSRASNNSVTIKNGVFQGAKIIGGRGESVTDNKVIIDGGTFNGINDNKIYGACINGGFEFSNNEVVLNGGIFTKATIIAADGDAAFSASGNKITIAAGSNALDLSGATLMGYENTFTYGTEDRTLNVARTNVNVGGIQNFGTINFNLAGVSSDAVVLKMQGASPYALSNLGTVSISVSGIELVGDDFITLLNNVSGDTTNITVSTSGGHVKVLGSDLIYYTGTEPLQEKADYTIKNGAGVVKKEESLGTYNSQINGNESTNEYSSNSIVIRRGTYNNYSMYGAHYTNTDTITMDNNSITIHSGTFNIGLCAAGANGYGNFTGNIITINDGTFADGTARNIYTVSDSSGGSATNNSIVINGGNIGSNKTISAANVRGTATGNTVTINGGTLGSNTANTNINIYGVDLNGGYGNTISGNEVNIKGGAFIDTMDIAGVCVGGGAGANTYNYNKVNISGGSFDLTTEAGGKINIYGVYRDGSVTAANYNSVVIANAQFNLDSDDEVKVYGANVKKGNVENNYVELNSGTYSTVYGGLSSTVDPISGADPTGSVGNANGNKVLINGGTYIGDMVVIMGGCAAGGGAKNNTLEITNGSFESTMMNMLAAGMGASGDVTGNKILISGGEFTSGSYMIYAGMGMGNDSNMGGDAPEDANIVTITGGKFTGDITITGGISQGSGMVKGNKVIISAGEFGNDVTIQGGNSTSSGGDAIKNSVEISGGKFGNGTTIHGAIRNGDGCNVESNKVIISAGEFGTDTKVFGGEGFNGYSNNNIVTVSNSSFGDDSEIYGGYSHSDLSSDNIVTIKSGAWEKVFGGRGYTGADSNTVIIDGGSFKESGEIYSGYTESGNANENYITINAGTFNNNDIGAGYTDNGNSNGNTVIVNGGNFEGYSGSTHGIWGGCSDSNGSTNENKVYINGGTFSGGVGFWGGYNNSSGEANNNYVEINSGSFGNGAKIYGGYTYSGSGNAKGNSVTIKNGTFNDGCEIYVGYTDSGNAEGNSVIIEGGTFGNLHCLVGGHITSGQSTNNTLNLKIKMSGTHNYVYGFQTMNFTLPSNITNGDVMLKAVNLNVDYDNGTATINVNAADGVKLNKDDIITLVDVSDYIQENYVAGDILGGAAEFYNEDVDGDMNGDGDTNDLVITLLQDFEQKKSAGSEDQQKAPVEGIAAAVQTVNMSADLASGEGMKSLVAETAGGVTNTFGALTAGQSKYKTGSHVDIDGWGLLVGAGKTKEWKNGTATTYGLFFEYGKGDFDTYNGNVHGDGNSKNQGVGIMVRHKLTNNTYYEGNIRYGKQSTEWGESEIGSYDTDSKYYGIMVGMGHIFPAGKNEIDVYGRYTFGHVGACDATVGDSHYNFESVKSHRVRLGAKYNFVQEKSNAKPYIGLAWEHEFKGESKASISGVGEAPAPSMKGNVGIMELGCDWDVSKKWTLGLGANAYIGKRKGWDGMARVFYNF